MIKAKKRIYRFRPNFDYLRAIQPIDLNSVNRTVEILEQLPREVQILLFYAAAYKSLKFVNKLLKSS